MAFLQLDFRSGYINSHQEVCVILPDEAPDQGGYPVLWLFHGANRDCSEWMRFSSIERYACRKKLAVIMPTTCHGYGMDMKQGADYYSMISKELIHVMRWFLPCLSRDRERNFTAGVSMGGFVAYKWALDEPELFSHAGGFSSAHDILQILTEFVPALEEKEQKKFANAFGTAEEIRGTCSDLIWMTEENVRKGIRMPRFWSVCGRQDFGYAQCAGAKEKFEKAGMDITWLEGEGGHDFDFWDPLIPVFLDWLPLGKEDE